MMRSTVRYSGHMDWLRWSTAFNRECLTGIAGSVSMMPTCLHSKVQAQAHTDQPRVAYRRWTFLMWRMRMRMAYLVESAEWWETTPKARR
jgi:hypothetical protein